MKWPVLFLTVQLLAAMCLSGKVGMITNTQYFWCRVFWGMTAVAVLLHFIATNSDVHNKGIYSLEDC